MIVVFNTLLSIIARTTIRKINKKVKDLKNTIKQLDLTSVEHSTAEEKHSSAHGAFSMTIYQAVTQTSINLKPWYHKSILQSQ